MFAKQKMVFNYISTNYVNFLCFLSCTERSDKNSINARCIRWTFTRQLLSVYTSTSWRRITKPLDGSSIRWDCCCITTDVTNGNSVVCLKVEGTAAPMGQLIFSIFGRSSLLGTTILFNCSALSRQVNHGMSSERGALPLAYNASHCVTVSANASGSSPLK